MFDLIKQHKLVSALLAINILVVLVAVIVIIYNSAKTAVIDIYVAPSSAKIEINGSTYDNFASYNVLPGEYHMKISMEGMQTKEYDFTLYDNGLEKIKTYLVGENGGFEYYVNNPDEEMILADTVTNSAEDAKAKKFVEEYTHVAGILGELPLEYYDRSDPKSPIGVYVEQKEGSCEDAVVCLVVYGGEQNREIVNELIKNAGYNPSDYKITFEEGE